MLKVLPLQEKTWQDKKFWELQVEVNGEVVKASLWPPHGYTFVAGVEQEIEGTLSKNDKGYWSIKCGNMGPRPAWKNKPSAASTENLRNANIQANMRVKAEGQAFGNSVTNATNLAIAYYKSAGLINKDDLKDLVIEFRDFLLDEVEKNDLNKLTKGVD